jgi:IgGFc binding protein
MRWAWLSVMVVLVAGAFVAAGGCSAGSESGGFGASGGSGGAGGSTNVGGTGQSGSGGDAGPILDVNSGDTEPACVTCSADLKKVLRCDGTLVKECGADQACAEGDCIDDPCEAARASKSTYGCEYWALNLDIIVDGAGACYATFIANTWDTPVHIQVERDGVPLDPAMFAYIPNGQGQGLTYAPFNAAAGLAPGEVVILFLAQSPVVGAQFRCPASVQTAVQADTAVSGTGRGKAFHVTTDRPVVAYQIFPFGGGSTAATSATLLFPTSAWDVNYIAVNAYTKSAIVPAAQPSLDIVAAEDDTKVTINPIAAIVGGAGVNAAPANQPTDYMLMRGEYLQLSQNQELTGSVVLADKPIGMFGGASCLNVPAGTAACDSAQQQIPPVQALGHNYVAVRYRGRAAHPDETVPWRLVGAVEGTELTYEPGPPAGAPTILGRGQLVEFNSPGPFVVRSQDEDHPFYLAAYMTGGENFNGEGDPEFVNVVPADQFLDSYVFFTDPTYSETNLVVVRSRNADGNFADVQLDCAGAVGGWQPVGNYEYARVDLVTGNFQNVGGCSNGRRAMWSEAPFGVTVWGWGSAASFGFFTEYVSYAYPAGESVKPINTVVVPPVPK